MIFKYQHFFISIFIFLASTFNVNSQNSLEPLGKRICPNYYPRVFVQGPSSICFQASVNLFTYYNSSFTYQWRKNGKEIPGANQYIFTTKEPGTYSVLVMVDYCLNLSDSITLGADDKKFAHIVTEKNILCEQDTITLKAEGGENVFWYYNNKRLENEYQSTLKVSAEGEYKAGVVNVNGCMDFSEAIRIKKNPERKLPLITMN
jgi:hypothetical protein